MSIQEARRAAFLKWWRASKYCQVINPTDDDEQRALDAWNAALDSVESSPGVEYWLVTEEGSKRYKDITIRVEVKS